MKLENFISKIAKIFVRSVQKCEGPKAAFLYSDLTPTTECDERDVCCNALDWALQNPQIRNVALSGPYGSGKSSVLMKFKELHGAKYHCIDISLASFPQTSANTANRELIEMSILQQIFYCEHARHIPDSRFKRIKHLASKSLFWKSLGLASWILICLFPIYFPHIVPEIEPSLKTYALIAWLFILLLGLSHFTAKLLRSVNGRKLDRLSIKSGEIELSKDSDPSILNKHLDEILYFFEVTDYNVVIIEDLDRFKNPDIFTKLREINLLLNRSQQIGRRIVFIYAIRDDLFQNKNRTKFFDFIIPIIPVINPTNASDVLSQKLGGAELASDLIDDISLYIDDMRLLKNICNEYFMYRDNLGTELNRDKIFALIVYKNLFPEDFVNLHIQQGAVYNVFARKSGFARERIREIEQQISELNTELKAIENLQITDIKELRAIYLEEIREHLPEKQRH